MKKTNKNYEVRVGRTEIILPHEDGKLTFIHPAKGPNNYINVMEQILDDNLKIPKAEYTASLLHAAYCGPEDFTNNPQISDVKSIMKNNWLWVANKNLWIPKGGKNTGVFVVYDEKGVGLTKPLNQGELEKELENGEDLTINGTKIKISKDRKIRFAPRDSYEGGSQSPEDFAKNGFVIASYLEQTNQLAEVSRTFNSKPGVWILNPKTPEQRVSAVDGVVDWLRFYGYFDGSGRCHAFGVLK